MAIASIGIGRRDRVDDVRRIEIVALFRFFKQITGRAFGRPFMARTGSVRDRRGREAGVDDVLAMNPAASVERGTELIGELMGRPDHKEGVRALIEKRRPRLGA